MAQNLIRQREASRLEDASPRGETSASGSREADQEMRGRVVPSASTSSSAEAAPAGSGVNVADVEEEETVPARVSAPRVPQPTAGPSTAGPSIQAPTLSRSSGVDLSRFRLRKSWRESVPQEDHRWILEALFVPSSTTGKPVLRRNLRMWWYPPEQPLVLSEPPASSDLFFAHRLFLWMPYRMLHCEFKCIVPACSGRRLTACGLHKVVRTVWGLQDRYLMASEYLECGSCHKKYISWAEEILKQMCLPDRMHFPALLTYRLALDMSVVVMARNRTLGNSPTHLRNTLVENHLRTYWGRVGHFLRVCQPFVRSGVVARHPFPTYPSPPSLPGAQWVLSVHIRDVLGRLEQVKSEITSTFGTILKMGSTKKITKKLAGDAAGTAEWATNVGNEHGQVLASVLTDSKGYGLMQMTRGLTERYRLAGVAPPLALYVDGDCCSGGASPSAPSVSELFPDWPDLIVRLDAFHFMGMLASCVTTKSHQLYPIFMSSLSRCVFVWERADVEALRRAKTAELEQKGHSQVSEAMVDQALGRKELAKHCRRATRGAEETVALIDRLLTSLRGPGGLDMMGVPLLQEDRIQAMWEQQRRHVPCLQDPPGLRLYMQTGTLTKGDHVLPVYRCARGSSSLESFHLHLNRFIPGTTANDVHFQAYLLDGLARWNAARERDITGGRGVTPVHTLSEFQLEYTVRELARTVMGDPAENLRPPRVYTGEKLGVEYLLDQTGKVLDRDSFDPDAPDPGVDGMTEELWEELDLDGTPVEMLWTEHPPREGLETAHSSSQQPGDAASQDSQDTIIYGVPNDVVSRSPPTEPAVPSTSDETEGVVSVGPDSQQGFSEVCALAHRLVELRHEFALTNRVVDELVALYGVLSAVDKERIAYPPRHRTSLTGRFAETTATTVPEADSVRRAFPGSAAQRPDLSRLVEAICVRLCQLYPAGTRAANRWTLILREYRLLRELVLSNGRLMDKTSIQLFSISRQTLSQWFKARQRREENRLPAQGILAPPSGTRPPDKDHLPQSKTVAVFMKLAPVYQGPLLPPPVQQERPVWHSGPPLRSAPRFTSPQPTCVYSTLPPVPTYILPTSPAPMSSQGLGVLQSAVSVSRFPLALALPSSSSSTTTAQPVLVAVGAGTSTQEHEATAMGTALRRSEKRRLQREEKGRSIFNKRAKAMNTCSKCGQPKILETGHRGFRGYVFCPFGTQSYQEFRKDVDKKREDKAKAKAEAAQNQEH